MEVKNSTVVSFIIFALLVGCVCEFQINKIAERARMNNLKDEKIVDCAHCKGSGKVTLSPNVMNRQKKQPFLNEGGT